MGRKQNKTQRAAETFGKVRFPIGVKLVSIITLILLISLGAITTLMSFMVSEDLRINAEDTNFTVNRRSAVEAETTLLGIRSNALLLLDTLNVMGSAAETGSLGAQARSFYFIRNPEVAAITLDGTPPMISERFFLTNEIDAYLVQEFLDRSTEVRERARLGETVILNAAAAFGIPLLVMFVPWEAGEQNRAAGIFFTADALANTFSNSLNTSFLINDAGEILVHPDNQLVMAGANIGSGPLARRIRASREPNFQILYEDEAGVKHWGAFRKLALGGAAVLTTVESHLVFEGIAATTRRNIYLAIAVLLIAVILIWFFAKSISVPIGRLTEAAGKIEVGDFELTLKEQGNDEINLLTKSFVRMGKALSSFSRFTNRELTRQAMQGTLALGGEPRMATLLFTDIRSFTMISEMLEPWEVVEFLNSYMTLMITCVDKTGGTVDKFMGDAIMAHWGAVTILDTPAVNALNAVKAALAMRSALRQFNQGRDGSIKQPRIRIGCGINSGPVVAGQIGSNTRMEYTVIGDTVNLASRTEGMNKSFRTDILITENTWNLIREEVIAEEMIPTKVKGKKEPVRMFAVINLRAKPGEKQKRPVNLTEVRTMLGLGVPDLKQLILNME
ncbi:adenylate/guanylate cyclase domain-containing protein [Spirochaetia bacterium]|nr:adenylate/guanylate cyclase domain-containing protein [Spirochaetia bacterium]